MPVCTIWRENQRVASAMVVTLTLYPICLLRMFKDVFVTNTLNCRETFGGKFPRCFGHGLTKWRIVGENSEMLISQKFREVFYSENSQRFYKCKL